MKNEDNAKPRRAVPPMPLHLIFDGPEEINPSQFSEQPNGGEPPATPPFRQRNIVADLLIFDGPEETRD